MIRIVTIAGAFVDRAAGLIATPRAATIGVILLLHGFFEVISAASAPAGVAARRLGAASAPVDHSAANQTPLVYSTPLLTDADYCGHGSLVMPTAKSGRVSLPAYPQWVPAHPLDSPASQRRQWRRPSVLAISAALHGGPPR
jgi:hypothetical protein